MQKDVFICQGYRSAIGRYGGALSAVRPDDLAAQIISALVKSVPSLKLDLIDEVMLGCANEAGEDNRNVARMAGLLAGLPTSVAATTINRLCGSGMDAVGYAARTIASGEAELIIAGGVESMSRAPFVMGKASSAFSRESSLYDTTIGWRFVNPLLEAEYGIDSMPQTAQNLADEFNVTREDQDFFALRSQQRAKAAIESGRLSREIVPIKVMQKKSEPIIFAQDEHPRLNADYAMLAKLSSLFKPDGSITAGNSSGVNDGAAAILIASEQAVKQHGLTPLARVLGMASAGVEPRIMGIGPAPASHKLLKRLGLKIDDIDLIELNEAFAAQALAVTRIMGLPDDAPHVNPNGGAIALGHPLGMSGARLVLTAAMELQERKLNKALCTMCIGVGQGIAIALARA